MVYVVDDLDEIYNNVHIMSDSVMIVTVCVRVEGPQIWKSQVKILAPPQQVESGISPN